MSDPFVTPAWVHNAVFYQIFPDRFATSATLEKPHNMEAWDVAPTTHGFKGGDLMGVLERLDYLQDLGVTAIYFTPVFQSASNHRYHTHDYYQVDPILGGNGALRRLLAETRRRGMRVVLDGVFNHASRGFFQFNHILECGKKSPYLDWFRVKDFPLNAYSGKPNYDCWIGLPALPEFNFANPQVRRFILDIARYWLDEGIDGWRLDVPFCVDDDAFWQEFRQVVKRANPQAYITGEIPWDAQRWLRGDQFDGVMNYLLTYACWGFFGGKGLDMHLVGDWYKNAPDYYQTREAPAFAETVTRLLGHYPLPAVHAQMNLLDSHDTARFLSLAGGDKRLQRLAATFLFTYPGAPCVYYGDEIGLEGGKDPDNRRAFPWDEKRWDLDLRAHYQQLIALRKQVAALRSGEFKVLHAAGQVLVYERRLAEQVVVTAINRSPQETYRLDLPAPAGLEEGSRLADALGGGAAQVSGGRLNGLNLPPLSAAVLPGS